MNLNNMNNNYELPHLPQTIIWPDDPEDIPWYMTRLYEQMAFSINDRDFDYFPMAITSTATIIPNLQASGSFILCVSGSEPYIDANGKTNYWPTQTWALNKTSPLANGNAVTLGTAQAGSGPSLSGVTYTLSQSTQSSSIDTSGYIYYFIKHSKTDVTGSFNVRIIGTQ